LQIDFVSLINVLALHKDESFHLCYVLMYTCLQIVEVNTQNQRKEQ